MRAEANLGPGTATAAEICVRSDFPSNISYWDKSQGGAQRGGRGAKRHDRADRADFVDRVDLVVGTLVERVVLDIAPWS